MVKGIAVKLGVLHCLGSFSASTKSVVFLNKNQPNTLTLLKNANQIEPEAIAYLNLTFNR